jgi:pimeloyl-ACP methyl ester carboxylesterase
MVHLAAAGDWRPIAADYMKWRKGFFDPSFPLFMTVTCASDVRRIDPATIATATAGTLFGDYRVRQHLAACERWTPGIEPLVRIARGTDVPLLVLTGDTDPVTPKRWADVVASQASKVKVVVLANNAHGDIGDCYTSLLTRFFDHPRGPLDSSCASTIPHPPFATKLP